MRILLLMIAMVLVAASNVRAEGLFLNAAHAQPIDSPLTVENAVPVNRGLPIARTETVVTSEVPPAAAEHDTSVKSGCLSGDCRHPSSARIPGVCCRNEDTCCAALWENYCRDKKPCWTPGSPRRHLGGCGLPLPSMSLPSLSLFHCFGHKHCCDADCSPGPADCADGMVCDSLSADTDASLQPSPTPLERTPPVDDGDAADDVGAATEETALVPPEKSSLPFGWKLPLKSRSNPLKSLPTARLHWPFPR